MNPTSHNIHFLLTHYFSVDKSGAQWCYLPEYGYDSCNDGNSYDFQSKRFPGRKWSYEACATPAPYYSPGSGSGNSDCVARYGANSPICTPGYNNNNNNGGCSGPRCNSGYNTGSGSGYNTGSGSGYNSGSGCTGGRCSGSGSGYNTGSSSCSGGRCSGSGSGYNTGSNNGFSGNLGSILGGSQGSGGSNPRTSSNTKDSSRVNFGR